MQPVWIESKDLHYKKQELFVSLYPNCILRVACQTRKTCGLSQLRRRAR